MKVIPCVRASIKSLRTQKGRAVLMMLGVIVGVGMLTSIIAMNEYARSKVERGFRSMMGGTWDVVIVSPNSPATRGMPTGDDVEKTLTTADAEAIRAQIPNVRLVSTFQNSGAIYKYEDRSLTAPIFAATATWLALWDPDPKSGTFFTEDDDARANRVAVIGMDIARELFGQEEPIGKTIKINDVNFEVMGLMRERGSGAGGGSMDRFAYVPFTTFTTRLFKVGHLTSVMAHLADPGDKDAVAAQIRTLLRERHHIPDGALDDFRLTSPIDALDRQLAQVAVPFERYIQIGSAVALLIGGLVVMNIMTISVSERTREIGLRRSLGAKQRDILVQFLLEAMVVTLLGGLIGATLSAGGSYALSRISDVPALLSWSAIGLSLLSSILIGILFGILPARRAAALDPILALRK